LLHRSAKNHILRVERGDNDQEGIEDEQGSVTQVGLVAVAEGCPN
jgi:coronatine-insensitive protein 1